MADNFLITGYWGEPHVTPENDRGINAGIIGKGRFVLPVGEQFNAEYIGNNTIRIYDGKLIDNGAAAGIPAGEYVDLSIANAGQGFNRKDIIVFQYERDTSSLVETGSFVVVKGSEVSGTASDPVLEQADLLSDTATLDQMPLWRVSVSGTAISAPVKLFEVAPALTALTVGDVANAVPNTRTVNGKKLSSNITLKVGDIANAVPDTRTVNGKALSSDVTLKVGDIANAVPDTRTVNGKALSSNITLGVADISGAVPNTRKVNGKALSSNITLSAPDVNAVNVNRGTAVAANTDMNDLTTPGTYYITEDVAQTVENLRYNRDLTIVDVRKMDDKNVLQIQYGILGGGFLFRRINVNNNAVSNWMGPPTTVNMVEPDEVGNIQLTAANISDAVPDTRTVNGKKLSSNITLGAGNFETVKDILEYDNHAFTPLPSSSDAYVEISSCSLRRSLFVDAWFFRAAIKTKKSINETVSVLNLPTDATPQKNIALAAYSSGAHFSALINDSGNIRITPMITGTGQSGFSGISSGVTLHLSGFWFADE